ncbi:methyltransferase domain-containing protein [Pontivivens insulae]|uniref:Methyltransferase type 11 domain-containing protein n=1 Tax=Pontivivens insulae TaxID=1639689 RepID=A0A2R8A7C2_9RHOB|nr:class I SAM-dependent methyltransferase [Pontivivens insulae]RED18015.1 hypothetical protein DFR53_0204 [Pontivivens insulae]SPF27908.1 hypothetical protein POI8812_00203 [Pontivivens insulae]
MPHVYSDQFFDYIDQGSRRSAGRFVVLLHPFVQPRSVVDLGSGRGIWLQQWLEAGVEDVLAVDGDYVDRENLAIPTESFRAADLTQPIEFERKFDLAQSLEVAEHLPASAADFFLDNLTRASNRILFSAAVPGQGGEFHVNERPLAYWQNQFLQRGYVAFDCIRPRVFDFHDVAPWYRYNSVLYLNEAGRAGLSNDILDYEVPAGVELAEGGNLRWRLRRAVVNRMPRRMVTQIAQVKSRIVASYLAGNARPKR